MALRTWPDLETRPSKIQIQPNSLPVIQFEAFTSRRLKGLMCQVYDLDWQVPALIW